MCVRRCTAPLLSVIHNLIGSSREAISGNLHGSGPFCEQFLSIWQQDGFSNYVVSSDDSGGDNPQSQEDEGLLVSITDVKFDVSYEYTCRTP